MSQKSRKVAIIGGGIAGLCAGVYALRSGYEVELFEQHYSLGGLATSWKRDGYTFETCLHWLVGSKPGGALNAEWREVCDIDRLQFVHHDEFVRLEDSSGEHLPIYSDVDRLEASLLKAAPEDAEEIRHFTGAVRHLVGMPMPRPGESFSHMARDIVKILPDVPVLWRLSHVSTEVYGRRFTHPLLRRFFEGGGGSGQLSVLALAMSLAWMSDRNGGYAIGGSQALIQLIAERFAALGGKLRLDAKVKTVQVRADAACGLVLEDGEAVVVDWVISAADLHATLYDMLGGRYSDPALDRAFSTYETFPSYLQVSLGVARDLTAQPGYLTMVLDQPFEVDPETRLPTLSFRTFKYDPTFAPPGKTAVTCFLPTRNFAWWRGLRDHDPQRYQAEKQRVADAVTAVLDRRMPGIRQAIEVADVSTPATVINYTGNWKGSMEGWLMTPVTGFGALPQTLLGLKRFAMVGQWVQPGGGLPSGLLTARSAIHALCHQDHVAFAA
jgi:phytoene dehydrogenase-like protein